MKKLIVLLAIPFLAIACSKNSSKNYTKKDVVGDWKVNMGEDNKDDVIIFTFTNDDKLEVESYSWADKSGEVQVVRADYKVEGNVIKTTGEDGYEMPDYRIVSAGNRKLSLDAIDDADGEGVMVLDSLEIDMTDPATKEAAEAAAAAADAAGAVAAAAADAAEAKKEAARLKKRSAAQIAADEETEKAAREAAAAAEAAVDREALEANDQE